MKFKFGRKNPEIISGQAGSGGAASVQNSGLKKLFGKKSVRIVSILLVIAIVAGIIYVPKMFSTKAASSTTTQRTAVVRKGNINISISGSGPLVFSNRVSVTSKVASTILALNFKEGDRVKKGGVLAQLDDTDARRNYEQVQDSVLQSQLSRQNTTDEYNDLTVTAPFAGQVKNLTAELGSTKNKNESLMTLIDTSKLKATLTFSGSAAKSITVGRTVTVHIQEFMESLPGKVTFVSSRPYSTTAGGELYSVEVEIANPGSIQEGMKASADIDTPNGVVSSIDTGTLSCNNKAVIKSSAGGTVQKVNVRENQYVKMGELLIAFDNKTVVRSMENANLSAKSSEEKLNSAKDQLDNCSIVAPIDGIISKLDLKAGDTVKVGDSVLVVSDDTSVEFKIPVDELDIDKIKVGQRVNITLDALSDTTVRPLTGQVSKVAVEGTSSNGVTTYQVTIKVDKSDRLKSGMNANGEVIINNKTGVLTAPVQAVYRVGGKSYVMIKGDAKTIEKMRKDGTYIDLFSAQPTTPGNTGNGNQSNRQQGTQGGNQTQRTQSNTLVQNKEYFANAIPIEVETGINNQTNIEIITGLKEGDVVILPPTALGSTQQNRVPGGAMPFGGGGQPPR